MFFCIYEYLYIFKSCGLRKSACKANQRTPLSATTLHKCYHWYGVMGKSGGLEAHFQGLNHSYACLLGVCNLRRVSNQDNVIFFCLLWVVNQTIYAKLFSTVRHTQKGFKTYHHHLPNAVSLSCVWSQLTFYQFYLKCDNIMLSGYCPFNRGNWEKSN